MPPAMAYCWLASGWARWPARLRCRAYAPGSRSIGWWLFCRSFCAELIGLALIHNFLALNLVLMIAGVGWLTINSSLNVAAQTTTPGWVQARALGVYLLVSQGGLAGGSAVWGLVAARFDEQTALLAAAGCWCWGWLRRAPAAAQRRRQPDLRPSQHSPHPELRRLGLEHPTPPVLGDGGRVSG